MTQSKKEKGWEEIPTQIYIDATVTENSVKLPVKQNEDIHTEIKKIGKEEVKKHKKK